MIIALVFVGTIVNFLDRLALSVLAPDLQKEFHLTNVQYSQIASSFLIAYAVTMFGWGAVFDWLGNRLGFALAVVVWSLAEIAHVGARGLASFCGLRAALGAGEAAHWPGATRTIAAWFPARQRALGIGIANAGASLGPAMAPPLIIALQQALGWRAVFLVTGLLGFAWLLLWLAFYPRRTAVKNEGERLVEKTKPVEHPPVPWRVLLRRREVWGIVLGRFFGDPVWWLYLNWLPLYLANARGFDRSAIAAYAWMPFAAAAVGAVSGGWLSGWLLQSGRSPNVARKTAIVVGTAFMTTIVLAAEAKTSGAAIAWMCTGCFGFQFWVGNVQTLPSDFFPVGAVGSIAGFAGTAAGLGAVIFTFSTGWIVDHYSYTPVLAIAAVLGPLATGSLFLLAGKVRRIEIS